VVWWFSDLSSSWVITLGHWSIPEKNAFILKLWCRSLISLQMVYNDMEWLAFLSTSDLKQQPSLSGDKSDDFYIGSCTRWWMFLTTASPCCV
jgi:hypothetical protein